MDDPDIAKRIDAILKLFQNSLREGQSLATNNEKPQKNLAGRLITSPVGPLFHVRVTGRQPELDSSYRHLYSSNWENSNLRRRVASLHRSQWIGKVRTRYLSS